MLNFIIGLLLGAATMRIIDVYQVRKAVNEMVSELDKEYEKMELDKIREGVSTPYTEYEKMAINDRKRRGKAHK